MKSDHNDEMLVSAVRKRLDAGVDELDARTLSRLRQARSRALEAGTRRPWWTRLSSERLPAGSFASGALLVLVIALSQTQTGTNDTLAVDELEIMSSSESLDLYEDLEFYQWLVSDEAVSG